MDPQQQQAANMMAGMGAGIIAGFLILWLAILAFMIWLFWRIFVKAGMSGALAFLVLIPGLGPIIVLCVLAFGTWNVAPVNQAYLPGQPPYPPNQFPPTYPPQGPTQY